MSEGTDSTTMSATALARDEAAEGAAGNAGTASSERSTAEPTMPVTLPAPGSAIVSADGSSEPGLEPASPSYGLTKAEVEARRAKGLGNEFHPQTSRSYLQIVRVHAFSFINTVLFAIGIALVVLQRIDDAILTAGMVLLNVIVGVSQEARAKQKLDQIALLNRPKASVVRDGQEAAIDPSELVLGDVLVVRPGDQIVVDGTVVGETRMEVDESLLTGESDRVSKRAGDKVYSGSFCVTGGCRYTADKVGANSFANQLTLGARAFRQIKTPLQRDVDFIVRLLVVLATQVGILLAIALLRSPMSTVERVQVAAVLAALVPQGLFAMVTLTYAMGALRMSGKGALIQQINAVESLSNVSVLCLDKTGTLTTNNLNFEQLYPLGVSTDELKRTLGDFAASTPEGNRTSEAICRGCDGHDRPIKEDVPFSSARKWSAISFDDDTLRGTYVLGAPEMLRVALQPGADLGPKMKEWAEQGLRVLLFAYRPEVLPLHDEHDEPKLPDNLIPLGLIALRDELRPEAQSTLQGFAQTGVRLKIISGDSPETVEALARQAGLEGDLRLVSGLELDAMSPEEFARAAAEGAIFGRISPQQKEQLVRALRAKGDYVAMIGDGVNDVLSLKQAQLAIAMHSGSQATRGVADIVLLDDSFAVLPTALQEGRRIIGGMQDVMRLVLTHTFYVAMLIVAVAIVQMAFPTTPKLRSMVTLFSVGIPTLAIAAWARPIPRPKRMLGSIMHFSLPAAITIAGVGLAIYVGYIVNTDNVSLARSALTTFMLLCGLLLVVFVEPPTAFWVAGDDLSGDIRPSLLALAIFVFYFVIMLVPQVREFFQFTLLPPLDLLMIAAIVAVWALTLRFVWRKRVFERLLSE